MLPAPCVSAGMLTITDFINILHRYYRSPLVSAMGRIWCGGEHRAGIGCPHHSWSPLPYPGPFFITRP